MSDFYKELCQRGVLIFNNKVKKVPTEIDEREYLVSTDSILNFDSEDKAVSFAKTYIMWEGAEEDPAPPNFIKFSVTLLVDLGFGEPQIEEIGEIEFEEKFLQENNSQDLVQEQATNKAKEVFKKNFPKMVWDDLKKQVKVMPVKN